MKTTTVFARNLEAYNSAGHGKLIVNQGGSSSSKTYSILQLLYIIAKYSAKALTIDVVSRSLPHLKQGAMTDFDNILKAEGYVIEHIKNQTDQVYKIGNSLIRFFGVEDAARVHGPRRNILYINECNHVSYEVYNQLAIRTDGHIFIDYNPTRAFWVHDEVIPNESHTYIQSCYKDNEELAQTTIERLESRMHNTHWWEVYGLGNTGRLEGAIFQNWRNGEFPTDLAFAYGLDFGIKDPDALVKCAIDRAKNCIYWKEEIYKTGNNTKQLAGLISESVDHKRRLIVADSAGKRNIVDLRDIYGFNIKPVSKNNIADDIKLISGYDLIIDPNSPNLEKELLSWEWADKKGEVPLDAFNHAIDAGRYIAQTLLNIDRRIARNRRLGAGGSRVARIRKKY